MDDVEAHLLRLPRNGDKRRILDVWFPTIARYIGIVVLLYECFIDRGQNPAVITAAMGLILLKTVVGNGNGKE